METCLLRDKLVAEEHLMDEVPEETTAYVITLTKVIFCYIFNEDLFVIKGIHCRKVPYRWGLEDTEL